MFMLDAYGETETIFVCEFIPQHDSHCVIAIENVTDANAPNAATNMIITKSTFNFIEPPFYDIIIITNKKSILFRIKNHFVVPHPFYCLFFIIPCFYVERESPVIIGV